MTIIEMSRCFVSAALARAASLWPHEARAGSAAAPAAQPPRPAQPGVFGLLVGTGQREN
jgi:hypothetical protein